MSSQPQSATAAITGIRSEATIYLGLVAVVLFFAVSGLFAYNNTRALRHDSQQVIDTHEQLMALQNILSLAKDAETSQRGFLMTGDESYLTPFNRADAEMQGRIDRADALIPDEMGLQQELEHIKRQVSEKMNELQETIELKRRGDIEAAMAVVRSDRGRNVMDALRDRIQNAQEQARAARQERIETMEGQYALALASVLVSMALGIVLATIVAQLVRRGMQAQQRQQWLQTGQAGIANAALGDLSVEQLGQNVLRYLADYLGAQAGAFFAREESGFTRAATYGVPRENGVPARFALEDGLLGQAARDNRTFIVRDVPENYLSYGSALGQATVREMVIAATASDGVVNAVLELGFAKDVTPLAMELLEKAGESVAVAVRSAHYRASLQRLLEETQRQGEELQAQSEELRVSNEELEEQSRALKESQTRLEQQQTELEQTNAQLEEQAQQLELQRDEISVARDEVVAKAEELERSSQYKSDFLANMSHELRTPLNSSLILAKLLADNMSGNLTEEQVEYARTIQSAGNDLLSLINDILDLSKIEAGHMEISPEQVSTARLMEDLSRTFRPIAAAKGLTLETVLEAGAPKMLETDRQRLEQILKNLLSNACKFTEKGGVTLSVDVVDNGASVRFSVRDTGIGISREQQETIFDAFRQADSTISRRYGGTGLGLSISRELVRLLGGTIGMTSESGAGSVFTVTVPVVYAQPVDSEGAGALLRSRPAAHEVASPRAGKPDDRHDFEAPPLRKKPLVTVPDDRENLAGDSRSILVVEDDASFARILKDLAHEYNFKCLVAGTAEAALDCVREYMPSAVILDVGLPDNSGLSVLDRLKSDSRTRHIPVHVVSADDYTETAYSLGAIGYNLKPVKREELVTALGKLQSHLSQNMRRVLIVEDDKVQRESLAKLLGTADVQTVGVGTAAECLESLEKTTFDCMVLDLSLPDASGYALLETLSEKEGVAFPPVIVYTGRALSAEEEQRLRKYSRSIIIKGAKSPERLLDEVTLFLHQVVSELPPEQQRMLKEARHRDAVMENRRILVVEDDIRNVYALTNIFEPRGAKVEIARNGREALQILERSLESADSRIDLVLMDVMMPEMDGLTATREIRKRPDLKKLPVIMLTAKAMKDDQERCISAGANDYMAKPLDVEKLLSLVRVWMPR